MQSDLSNNIKQDFFQTVDVSILLYGCTIWTLTKRIEKNLDGNYTRMLCVVLDKSRSSIQQNSHYMATYLPSQKLFKLDKQYIWSTIGKTKSNSLAMFFYKPLHMDVPILGDHQRLTSALHGHRMQPRGPTKSDG